MLLPPLSGQIQLRNGEGINSRAIPLSADTIREDVDRQFEVESSRFRTELEFLGITTDGAANNKTMVQALLKACTEKDLKFSTENHVGCVAHAINIAAQAAIKTFGGGSTWESDNNGDLDEVDLAGVGAIAKDTATSRGFLAWN
ncbi:hypothetical protein M427DRAFT_33480 [Gonapodya prolifera JEL478]|uniref:DUF659 domain-containing protein n=1 Tax=Gonapodya prolifera (strain JEL478) TaxID=1344416 RepID=A0A139ABK9_GONPJ|nr:hypothetical protein M427DRAFT_33480 [Gonapodya prolifera JEL478]|eukprot:KXS14059.1 hypothetical protein M427DRAFT_33480 [Gonapodya prolifera JEL478]